MKVNGRNYILRYFVNVIEDFTAYETVNVSTNEVRKKCVKCGRIRIFYCKDENFNYCDNCGRKILLSEDIISFYGKTVLDFAERLKSCRHCPHFDEEEFKCDKPHHCDCDCSLKSYV